MTSDATALLKAAAAAVGARDFRRAHGLCLDALARDPGSAEALFLLGVIAAEHGNFAKAAEIIGRAIARDGASAEYHAQHARCLIASQQPRAALEAARRALALSPRDAPTLDTLGVALTRAGAHAEAVAPFRAAVARKPGNAAMQYNLGAALQFIGDFAGAAAAYRAAIAADPAHPRAWSALAQVHTLPFDAAEERALLALAGRQGLDPDAELSYCHALAKQREDQGRHAEAYSLLARGKARKRATLDYRVEQDLALFEAARRGSEALVRAQPGEASEEPVFIVGMPRTGTTLVERVLSSHPAVFAAGELTHFALALKRATGTPSRYVLDAQTLLAAPGVDLAGVGRAYLDSTRPRTGHTPRFIDKMPLNVLLAGVIARALPNARIICVRRHPLDTCLSNWRQLFATGFSYYNYSYDLLDTGRYWQAFDALAAHWRETLGPRYCEVHYEHVVADLEPQARRLVAFCGLDWDPACIDFHQNQAPVATASSVQVREPIYRRAVGRWRHYERELAPLIELLGPHARA